MRKPVLFGVIFVVIVLAVIVYSTLNLAKFQVEVCMTVQRRHQLPHGIGATAKNTH